MGVARLVRRYGDPALAIALSALIGLEAWAEFTDSGGDPANGPGGRWLIDAALGLALAISLAWRRRAPVPILAIGLVGLLLSGRSIEDQPEAWVLALLVALYSVGAGADGMLAVVGAMEVITVMVVAVAREPGQVQGFGDVAFLLLILAGPWFAGSAIRLRRQREHVLEQRAVVLERDREASAREAVTAERARIARELHDVVAHALSVIVLQARGGRRAMSGGSGAAREALDTIEGTGTEALAEMRRLVGVLRTEREGAALSPQPGLRDLAALAEQVRGAGLPVDVSVEGDPIELPPGLDLAAYRILQEALTNCLKHAGSATARVVVRYGEDGIDLEVTDSGQPSDTHSGGHGLIGMRERVALYGGSIDMGPGGSGGFVVRARLPLRG